MTSTKRAIVLALVVFAVVVGTSGLAVAAAPSVDTETSNTASTSEVNGGDTIQYNASTNSTLQFEADSLNGSVKTLQNGTELETFENATDSEIEQVGTDGAGLYYYNFTVADDETGLEGVEADAGENVDIEYRMINDTTLVDPDTANITVTWANDANKSFVRAEGADTETAEPSIAARGLASVPIFGDDNTTNPAKIERTDIGVNGADQDEITVWVAGSDAQDALAETYDTSTEAEAVAWNGAVKLDGDLVPVKADSTDAPDWLDTDEQTYAEVSEGGNKIVVYNAGDSLGEDTSTIDMEVRGNEKVSMFDVADVMQDYGASRLTAWGTAVRNGDRIPSDPFEG